MIEWFKGSALRPYLDRLSPDDGQAFLAEYRQAIHGVYPSLAERALLRPFPRLFMGLTAADKASRTIIRRLTSLYRESASRSRSMRTYHSAAASLGGSDALQVSIFAAAVRLVAHSSSTTLGSRPSMSHDTIFMSLNFLDCLAEFKHYRLPTIRTRSRWRESKRRRRLLCCTDSFREP